MSSPSSSRLIYAPKSALRRAAYHSSHRSLCSLAVNSRSRPTSVDEVTSNGACAEDLGELGEAEQPVGVPGGPVGIVPVGDPVDDVVGLSRFVQQLCNASHSIA